jgi:hypothetical protein
VSQRYYYVVHLFESIALSGIKKKLDRPLSAFMFLKILVIIVNPFRAGVWKKFKGVRLPKYRPTSNVKQLPSKIIPRKEWSLGINVTIL